MIAQCDACLATFGGVFGAGSGMERLGLKRGMVEAPDSEITSFICGDAIGEREKREL